MRLFTRPEIKPYHNDERIKYEQYRAGYYAFITVSVLFLSAGAVALFFWDDLIPVWIAASVATAILMVGFWIVVIMNWRAGVFEAYREQVNRTRQTRRRMLLKHLFSLLWFGVWMGVSDYFLLSDIPSVSHSLVMGTVNGVLFGATMYWLELRKVRKAEQEDGITDERTILGKRG